jgi:hypothetical protein
LGRADRAEAGSGLLWHRRFQSGFRDATLCVPSAPRYREVCHVGAGVLVILVGAISGGRWGRCARADKATFERLGSVLFDAGSSSRARIAFGCGLPMAFLSCFSIRVAQRQLIEAAT